MAALLAQSSLFVILSRGTLRCRPAEELIEQWLQPREKNVEVVAGSAILAFQDTSLGLAIHPELSRRMRWQAGGHPLPGQSYEEGLSGEALR